MKNTNILDLLIALLLVVPNTILTKFVLNQIGILYDWQTLANMTWKQYWCVTFVFTIFVSGLQFMVMDRQKKPDLGKFSRATNSIAYTFGVLLTWGIAALVSLCW